MANSYQVAALALCLISSVTSMGFFRITQKIGSQDPIVMAGSFNQSGLNLGNSGSVFSDLFENNSSPSEFVRKASTRIFDSVTAPSMNLANHPKPDKRTKRAYIRLNLRWTLRGLKSLHDVRRFLDHGKAEEFVSMENPCDGVSEPCPYLELRKKQLGRLGENLNDEIAFIQEILKKKDCPYLRLKVAIFQRDVDNVNAIIKYIDDHNKIEDNHKDLIELFKHLVDNHIQNLNDVEDFLRNLLENADDAIAFSTEKPNHHGKCPYLSLQERLQWRETVNRADGFGFVFWLNHRGRHNRRDGWKLRRRIKHTIRRLARIYGARRHHRRHKHHRPRVNTVFRPMGLFQRSLKFDSLAKAFKNMESRFGLDQIPTLDLVNASSKVSQTA